MSGRPRRGGGGGVGRGRGRGAGNARGVDNTAKVKTQNEAAKAMKEAAKAKPGRTFQEASAQIQV